jgi:hypothetical protein
MRVLLLLVAAVVLRQLPQQPVVKHGTAQAKTKGTQTQMQNGTSKAVSPLANDPREPQSEFEEGNSRSNSEVKPYRVQVISQPPASDTRGFWIYICLTAVGTVVNAAILMAILRQNRINWRQAKINLRAARATQRAASSASHNVQAMVDSNNINREAMHRGQRAYVWFSPIDPVIAGVKDKDRNYELAKWNIQVPVENAGNTPTKDLKMCFNWVIRKDELPENFTYPDQVHPAVHTPLIIGPKGRIFTGSIVISNEDIQKIRVRESRLYLYGWATYHDVFEGTSLHRTEFCFEASPYYVADAKEVEVGIQLMFHHRHNSHT